MILEIRVSLSPDPNGIIIALSVNTKAYTVHGRICGVTDEKVLFATAAVLADLSDRHFNSAMFEIQEKLPTLHGGLLICSQNLPTCDRYTAELFEHGDRLSLPLATSGKTRYWLYLKVHKVKDQVTHVEVEIEAYSHLLVDQAFGRQSCFLDIHKVELLNICHTQGTPP